MSQNDMTVNRACALRDAELLARIEAFDLDNPSSVLPFSRRLARDNGWKADYALRVIREYKRFAYLAVESGHPVAPSEAVDQAWHLHLIYTESYWKEFCGEVLRKPFHHGPTRGGAHEGAKHWDWYARTLASYRDAFDEDPPEDIWPSPEERFRDAASFRRINVQHAWVIPKPAVWTTVQRRFRERPAGTGRRAVARLAVAAAVLLVLGGCLDSINIFDYRGAEFLRFFLTLMVICFSTAAAWRALGRVPARQATDEDIPTDAYEIAFLAGGPRRVLESALAELLQRGAVETSRGGKIKSVAQPNQFRGLHPVELRLLTSLSSVPESFNEIQKRLKDTAESIGSALAERGLTLSQGEGTRLRNQSLLWAGLAPAIGLMKIAVGVARDKPVGFLILLTIISGILALVFFLRRPIRTRLGSSALSKLQAQFSKLRTARGMENLSPAHTGMLATAVGLYGMSILANTALAEQYTRLQSQYPSSSGDSGGSGCGSDSGSDSGGGGGGCGGCGGGGGD